MLRYAASVAIIVCSVVLAGIVGARVFGIRPWEYTQNISNEDKMENRSYAASGDATQESKEVPSAVNNEPTYIPKGLKRYSEMIHTVFHLVLSGLRGKVRKFAMFRRLQKKLKFYARILEPPSL